VTVTSSRISVKVPEAHSRSRTRRGARARAGRPERRPQFAAVRLLRACRLRQAWRQNAQQLRRLRALSLGCAPRGGAIAASWSGTSRKA
jgi:hypothetical protein